MFPTQQKYPVIDYYKVHWCMEFTKYNMCRSIAHNLGCFKKITPQITTNLGSFDHPCLHLPVKRTSQSLTSL